MTSKGKKKSKRGTHNKENVKLVNAVSEYGTHTKEELKMMFETCRLDTFSDWPFNENNACNPAALAAAGFYHIPTDTYPDATRCFCCYKELDGWEPQDDPVDEHKKHSPQCAFLALRKSVPDLTMDELLKLECERQKNKWNKFCHMKQQELDLQAERTCKELEKLAE